MLRASAAGCGDTAFKKLILRGVGTLLAALFMGAAQFEHKHPDILPTDPGTWLSCCHDQDCMEAPVSVTNIDADWSLAQIADFPLVKVQRYKIKPSMNGRTYFCRYNTEAPPDADNLICLFIARPPTV